MQTMETLRHDLRLPSERELQVVAMLAAGASNDETARDLGFRPKTVESHLRTLFDRYGLVSRTELAMRAVNGGAPARLFPGAGHSVPQGGMIGAMRTGLALDDLGDLLELPIVAVLATYRRDGSVMLSPVWHEWRDGGFNIWTGGVAEGKVRHIERDPRASLVVAEQAMPYRGVDASGRATLSLDGFHDVVRRTAARYMSPEEADAFAASYPEPRTVIRLVPDRIRAWDFTDDVPSTG